MTSGRRETLPRRAQGTNAATECASTVSRWIAAMDHRQKVAQMVIASTERRPGSTPSDEIRSLVEDYGVGSILVVDQSTPRAAAAYNDGIQRSAAATPTGVPLLIAADFEFGASHTVPGGTTLPLAMAIGATRDAEDAATAARITAREASAMGFNWMLAPVADVNTNPINPAIGVRSFAEKASLVAEMTARQVAAFEEERVIATPKHFPGHGGTSVDSHTVLPVVAYDRAILDDVHLAPFRAAIAAGADAIMTAHVVVEAVDPSLPATLSSDVLTGLLRQEMNYDGVIVTDALNMAAITESWPQDQAAVMAARAGADVLMSVGSFSDHVAVIEALARAVEAGDLSTTRVDEAVRRVLRLKCDYGLSQGSEVDPHTAATVTATRDHRAAAIEIGIDSMTLVKNDGVLPLRADAGSVLVAGVDDVSRMAAQLRALTRAKLVTWQSGSVYPTQAEIQEATELARRAEAVIALTYSRGALPGPQALLVNALTRTGTPVVAVSLGFPTDLDAYEDVDAFLASYARGPWPHVNPTAIQAAASVIVGRRPGGRLPVAIDEKYPYGHGLDYDSN